MHAACQCEPWLRALFCGSAGGTRGRKFTIDVSDYVNNVLNGRTDSRARAAFAVVRTFRHNAAGGGTYGYPADSLGNNNVVRPAVFVP